MPPPGPVSPSTHAPPIAHVNATVVVVVGATVVVVVGATVVVVVGATVVVVVGATVVVVVGATVVVVVGAHGSVTWGANAKPPNNTSGATTTDIRPADARTQRVTIKPATNKNTPATTTRVEPPVSGKRHTSTANISTPITEKYTVI